MTLLLKLSSKCLNHVNRVITILDILHSLLFHMLIQCIMEQNPHLFGGPKIWELILSNIKGKGSPLAFKKVIKIWKPSNCPCRLRKKFIQNVGLLWGILQDLINTTLHKVAKMILDKKLSLTYSLFGNAFC